MEFLRLLSNAIRISIALLGLSALSSALAESTSHQLTPAQATTRAPSPITPVFSEITSFTGYTGPFPYFLDTFTVGQSGIYTVTLSTPAVSNGVYILSGTFAPSTGTPSTPLSSFLKFKQALNNTSYTVSLNAGEVYSALQIFSTGTSAVTLSISGPGCVGFGSTSCFVPFFDYKPYVTGVEPPAVLNMAAGQGPSLNACLLSALQPILGGELVYLGQNRTGESFLRWNGSVVSYFPLSGFSGNSSNPAIQYQSSNLLLVQTSCGALAVAPAPVDLAQFGAALNALGMVASIDQNGVITTRVNGVVTVLRPDYVVTKAPASRPGFSKGADGRFSFTDHSGNMQMLQPAFLDPQALVSSAGGSITIQLDGTAIQTLGAQRWMLVPDGKLASVPAEHVANLSAWQDGENHFSYRIQNVKPFPQDLFQFTYTEGYKRILLP